MSVSTANEKSPIRIWRFVRPDRDGICRIVVDVEELRKLEMIERIKRMLAET